MKDVNCLFHYINWPLIQEPTLFKATTFTRKPSECEIKRHTRVGKNDLGGPEKQVIVFVWRL